jgi:hypothetical protein
MKQNITTDQLAELNEEQRKRLNEWWKPADGDCCAYWNGRWKKFTEMVAVQLVHIDDEGYEDGGFEKGKADYPLLSIGQMIEFLLEKEEYGHNDWDNLTLPVPYRKKLRVCDDLWEAVKEVL